MVKCYNCDKPAIYAIGPEGQRAPLCLDCYAKFVTTASQQQAMLQQQVNYLTAQMDYTVGLSSTPPRFPEPPPIINVGGATLNNIHIENSQVGVVNTGSIGSVDSAVTVLRSIGDEDLASAIVELTEAVLSSNEIGASERNEIVEILAVLSQEAVAPEPERKTAVARGLLARAADILGGIATLATVWDKARPLLESLFS